MEMDLRVTHLSLLDTPTTTEGTAVTLGAGMAMGDHDQQGTPTSLVIPTPIPDPPVTLASQGAHALHQLVVPQTILKC